jgi:hypothetical protein
MAEKTLTRRQALVAAGGFAVAASGVAATSAHAEYQPMMQAALNSLTMAKAQLVNGTADKGGHRMAALNHVNQAIMQVQLGIAFDDTH